MKGGEEEEEQDDESSWGEHEPGEGGPGCWSCDEEEEEEVRCGLLL